MTWRRNRCSFHLVVFFFFNDTATTEIYTLSLHDALPISPFDSGANSSASTTGASSSPRPASTRSAEHTSELQSRQYLVCRLLLGKKKTGRSHHRRSCDGTPQHRMSPPS